MCLRVQAHTQTHERKLIIALREFDVFDDVRADWIKIVCAGPRSQFAVCIVHLNATSLVWCFFFLLSLLRTIAFVISPQSLTNDDFNSKQY